MTTAVRSYPPFPLTSRTAPAAPRLYSLTDLGTHVDGAPLLPVAINDAGDIAASAAGTQPPGIFRGFCLSGALRIPAGVAFGQSPVTALNHREFIAGATGISPQSLRAWASHLGAFGEKFWPDSVSTARGINADGTIVGNVMLGLGDVALSRAFVLSPERQARFVTPPNGGTTFATGINDAGDVVFNAAPLGAAPGETRAWCLHENYYIAIASLGGGRAWATAITPQGRVVGHSLTAEGETHAFLWEDGHTLDLNALPGGMSQALAANDQRVVVGRVIDAEQGNRAFRWTPDKGMMLLDECVAAPHGWVLGEAVGLNAAGEIIGTGTWHGQPRGFVLRPEHAD